MESIRHLDYEGPALHVDQLPPTPLHTISHWVRDAIEREQSDGDIIEPGALMLATADASGQPDVRVVLMRFLDERGPGFVTHSTSSKCSDIAANPNVSALLAWMPLFRQVRFCGRAEPIDEADLQDYWRSRPRGAQVAAVAVRQGEPIESRAAMDRLFAAKQRELESLQEIPMPDTFVGYRIRCTSVELWSGRDNRMHDRIRYDNPSDLSLSDPGLHISRLQP